MLRRIFLCLAVLASAHSIAPAMAQDRAEDSEAALWRRLQAGGHVLVIRHAATDPGVGDPPGFTLADCASQRNLSAAGRADAQALGAAFKRLGVPVGRVLSSRWCRCVDTARLAFGRVETAPMLDSGMADDDTARERKLTGVRAAVTEAAASRGGANLVLVTHDVNIRALTGDRLAQGEMVVATPRADGSLAVVGRLGVPRSGDAATSM